MKREFRMKQRILALLLVAALLCVVLPAASAAELVNGTKEGSQILLDPQGSATRAQVAAILTRYIQKVQK